MNSRRFIVALVATGFLATGCSIDAPIVGTSAEEPPPEADPATISVSIPDGREGVRPDRAVVVRAEGGTIKRVNLRGPDGLLKGRFSENRTVWTNTDRLQPGELYRVRGEAANVDGKETIHTSRFHTRSLTSEQQIYPGFYPMSGSTVGVGMPLTIQFDAPVADKATFERHLKVVTKPRQVGSFRWISDREVRWRPKEYWKPGTKITLHADIDSIPAGNGYWGQESRTAHITIGRSMVSRVNVQTHKMKVFENGKRIRVIPVSTGSPEWPTRNGTKVIVSQERYRTMDSSTVGIPADSPGAYRIKVEYAQRLTYSGEFIHAAPWSLGSHGNANVSHGCTGMSTANAAWFMGVSMIGDPVEYVGSNRPMELTNGLGDWNLPFAEYRKGSALYSEQQAPAQQQQPQQPATTAAAALS